MNKELALTNHVTRYLEKSKYEFTRQDLMRYIIENNIERITFHYTGLDGQIKEMKIPLMEYKQAERILAEGERVDGSSLFKGLVDTGLSDLYVVPVYSSAFLNPFYPNSLDFVCRYITADGSLAPFAPDNVLINASKLLKQNTGFDLFSFGELEFYIFNLSDSEMYTPPKQQGYHAVSPFIKTGKVISEILRTIAPVTGNVKYAHTEVGYIKKLESTDMDLKGRTGEQMEIEFLPAPAIEAADNVVLAKWIIRNVCYKKEMLATFAPKLEEGDAGNGMHFHLSLMKDGKNEMTDSNGKLSFPAKNLIGGLCKYADTLTAFGNTISSSYLRLVPNQEAPTKVCWSDSNRSVMIRVPLSWTKTDNLASVVNEDQPKDFNDKTGRQTVELRSPDGSGNAHMLLAGVTLAAEWGLTNSESEKIANDCYIKGNIHSDPELIAKLPSLPDSCHSSALKLLEKKELYQKENLFPDSLIKYVVNLLESEKDSELLMNLTKMSSVNRARELREIMHKKIHRH